VLHIAVEHAIYLAPPYNGSADPSTSGVWFNGRMEMIRYLIDEVGIDVNTEWWRPGQAGATPMDRVAYRSGDSMDVRELVWFLLDRGADPSHASVSKDDYFGDTSYLSPLEKAQMSPEKRFLEAIQQGSNDSVMTRPDEFMRRNMRPISLYYRRQLNAICATVGRTIFRTIFSSLY
jgi:hypothetical protein